MEEDEKIETRKGKRIWYACFEERVNEELDDGLNEDNEWWIKNYTLKKKTIKYTVKTVGRIDEVSWR